MCSASAISSTKDTDLLSPHTQGQELPGSGISLQAPFPRDDLRPHGTRNVVRARREQQPLRIAQRRRLRVGAHDCVFQKATQDSQA